MSLYPKLIKDLCRKCWKYSKNGHTQFDCVKPHDPYAWHMVRLHGGAWSFSFVQPYWFDRFFRNWIQESA